MRDRTVTVTKANEMYFKTGGTYDMTQWEAKVAKLHLLQVHLELLIETMCETGESDHMYPGAQLMDMADKLYTRFAPYVEQGVDIFVYENWQFHETFQMLSKAYAESRQYVCVWGEGYEPTEPKIVGLEFFSRENGFDDHAQLTLMDLSVGESYQDYSCGTLTIVRSK